MRSFIALIISSKSADSSVIRAISSSSTTITGKLIYNNVISTSTTTISVTSGRYYAIALGRGYDCPFSATNFTTIIDSNQSGFHINATDATGFVRLIFGKATANSMAIGTGDYDNNLRIIVVEVATS